MFSNERTNKSFAKPNIERLSETAGRDQEGWGVVFAKVDLCYSDVQCFVFWLFLSETFVRLLECGSGVHSSTECVRYYATVLFTMLSIQHN